MKKTIILLLFIVFGQLSMSAQRVDIDNYRIYYRYANLPTNYIPADQRSYKLSVDVNSPYSADEMYDKFRLYGWKKVEDNSTLDIFVRVYGLYEGTGSVDKKVSQKKDKSGKVISTTRTYAVTSRDTGKGYLSINGPKNINKGKKKKEKKKKEKKVEEENPFLKGVDTDVKIEEEEDDNKMKSDKERAYYIDISESYSNSTNYLRSTKAAWNDYNSSRSNWTNNNTNKYEENSISSAISSSNYYYGYSPKKSSMKFKTMDSKKHPENKKFNSAMEALKVILAKTSYNQELDQIKEDLAPIISYFEGVEKKYRQDKKHPRRVRGAALYNLGKIYYILDMPEKAIEMGNAIIKMDYKKKRGKKIIKIAERLKNDLAFHHMDSRHLISSDSEKDEKIIEEEEEDDSAE